MGKGGSERAARLDARRPLVNTGAPLPGLEEAQQRVLDVQRKLHEWASCGCRAQVLRSVEPGLRSRDVGGRVVAGES
jgi:hypothetical protein